MTFVATAILGAGVVGAVATGYAANKAAGVQENAASQAAALQQQQLDFAKSVQQTNQTNVAPYLGAGTNALDELAANNYYTAPVTMDEATLKNTPGYQFNLTQGLKATQNSAAARGLGISGAALKGASTFATGLADSTYQNQFNNAVTNQTNAYNRLFGIVNTGANAATGINSSNQQTVAATGTAATNTGSALIGGANAGAAATNATGTAVNNAAGSLGTYALIKGLYGQGDGYINTGNDALQDAVQDAGG